MNPLPPLRTVRSVASQAGANAAAPAPALPVRNLDPALQAPNLPTAVRDSLQELLDLRLTDSGTVRKFLTQTANRIPNLNTRERVAQALVHAGVLTSYQRDRVLAGSTFGLLLGHYRVLDRIGGGSVGIVFLGEHIHLQRRVAIKVLPVDQDVPVEIQERFHTEMRLLASLEHPHIVTAYDAGVLLSPEPTQPSLHYLVLELVPGGDWEQYVCDHGPLPIEQACEWARQAAAGLQAAHDRHLIHRDLKPSNLLLTELGQVKVVDFGLARHLASNLTHPTTLLGSVEFMAPEQSLDPTSVGAAADIYGLGACLYWILTGQLAIPRSRDLVEMVQALQTGQPRHLKELLPNVPAALDALVHRMMARDPAHRPTALQVMQAMNAFTGPIELTGDTGPSSDSEVIRLRQTVRQLERSLKSKEADARKAEEAVLFALATMAEANDHESTGHVRRMQEYVRLLSVYLATHPEWMALRDSQYVAEMIRCVPLHDIGKSRLPDAVMNKPGLLNFEERAVAETHAQRGCDIVETLARKHGDSLRFLSMARAVVRHHHERWDGSGYPDQLAGTAIPPAARLVALADVYDALRVQRPHRPPLSHAETVATIREESGGLFDPTVVRAFQDCEKRFDEVFLTIPD